MKAAVRTATLAIAAIILDACTAGGKAQTSPLLPPANPGTLAPAAKVTIAGVGDSLTAGVQSSGLMGADLPVLGVDPLLGQIGPEQRTQEHGFFALLWEQANGVDITVMSDPTLSPLPLLTPPGVGPLLAPTTSGLPAPVTTYCDAKQGAANDAATALSLRENPALNPYDVAVPGQTMHEAVAMVGPVGTCQPVPSPFAALNALVNGESQNFYPILGGFGSGITQLAAADALHAQLATVWLGSNDLLKVALSNGAAPVTAPQSLHDDLVTILTQLKASGAKVAVANLFDVLGAGAFIPQPSYQAALLAEFVAGCTAKTGQSATTCQTIVAPEAQFYASAEIAQAGLGPAGYFTLSALFKTLQAAAGNAPGGVPAPAPALVTGDYVSDAVAGEVKGLNQQYNAAIGQAVSETGAVLVDVAKSFATAEQNGGVLPVAVPDAIKHNGCCSLQFGGGFTSLDGLHPSNTGYAVIANLFIAAIDSGYGYAIPPVNVQAVYDGDPYAL